MFQSRRGSIPLDAFVKRLEVSRATVKRDIEYLRDRFHWKIVWDARERGYRLDGVHETLPAQLLSAREIQTFLLLDDLLSSMEPTFLGEQLKPLRLKLIELLGSADGNPRSVEKRMRILAPAARISEPVQFKTISAATAERKALRIRHCNREANRTTERDVSPQRLTLYRGTWYLEGWCHRSEAVRRFAIDAITEAKHTDLGCKEVSLSELDAALGQGYGIFAGRASHFAVVRFSTRVAPWVEHEVWHPNQEVRRDDLGRVQLTIPYSEDTELLMDVMRYGPDAEVLQPVKLRRRMVERLEATTNIYRLSAG
jgi:predicted DNA-binding transcriptional regulator YafY